MAEYVEKEAMRDAIKNYGHDAIEDGRKTLDVVDDIAVISGMVDLVHPALNWISVEKRLPKPYVSVLLYDPGEPATVFEGYYVPEDNLFMAANLHHGLIGRLLVGEEVTHWMAMPAPPEEERT